jgi:hypothetical protein
MSPTPESEAPTLTDLPSALEITRSVIRRLDAEGDTPRQIAKKLGVAQYFIEKVLRGEAELLSKCGEREPPQGEPT